MSRLATALLAAGCAWSLVAMASGAGPGARSGLAPVPTMAPLVPVTARVDLPRALDRVLPELPDVHLPVWAERWLYNPRERTAAGRDALRDGRQDDGVEALDAALRQAPDDPTVLYNAGTGRLLAQEQQKRAAALLEQATARLEGNDAAPPGLASHAFYNLGNARLASGDAAGAATAYRQSLRLDPSLRPAKRNLEIALARIDRDRPQARPPEETPSGERSGEEETSDRSGGTEPPNPGEPPEQRNEGAAGGQQGSPGERGDQAQTADAGDGGDGSGDGQAAADRQDAASRSAAGQRLLRFDEQADMTASEAAALLDAIDNLERAERRQAALERAAAEGKSTEEDW